jgi:hypothetical protein
MTLDGCARVLPNQNSSRPWLGTLAPFLTTPDRNRGTEREVETAMTRRGKVQQRRRQRGRSSVSAFIRACLRRAFSQRCPYGGSRTSRRRPWEARETTVLELFPDPDDNASVDLVRRLQRQLNDVSATTSLVKFKVARHRRAAAAYRRSLPGARGVGSSDGARGMSRCPFLSLGFGFGFLMSSFSEPNPFHILLNVVGWTKNGSMNHNTT